MLALLTADIYVTELLVIEEFRHIGTHTLWCIDPDAEYLLVLAGQWQQQQNVRLCTP